MKVCVAGLWHLGCVTAACLASAGHTVIGLDDDDEVVEALTRGRPPVLEPGLESLIHAAFEKSTLSFTTDPTLALRTADVLWVAWDTSVDEDDRPEVDVVRHRVERLFPFIQPGTLVVVSSQLPVGSTGTFGKRFAEARPGVPVTFVCSPENLRLGHAIERFTHPDRVIGGTAPEADRERIASVFASFTDRIEWMSIESAEIAKHAINAFLATSVTFINEVATVCEHVGADAADVARALKTDERIGPRAYLSPGAAFAGGTLAPAPVSPFEHHSPPAP